MSCLASRGGRCRFALWGLCCRFGRGRTTAAMALGREMGGARRARARRAPVVGGGYQVPGGARHPWTARPRGRPVGPRRQVPDVPGRGATGDIGAGIFEGHDVLGFRPEPPRSQEVQIRCRLDTYDIVRGDHHGKGIAQPEPVQVGDHGCLAGTGRDGERHGAQLCLGDQAPHTGQRRLVRHPRSEKAFRLLLQRARVHAPAPGGQVRERIEVVQRSADGVDDTGVRQFLEVRPVEPAQYREPQYLRVGDQAVEIKYQRLALPAHEVATVPEESLRGMSRMSVRYDADRPNVHAAAKA